MVSRTFFVVLSPLLPGQGRAGPVLRRHDLHPEGPDARFRVLRVLLRGHERRRRANARTGFFTEALLLLQSVTQRHLRLARLQEIAKIESGEWPADDNPLKNAPHTQQEASFG